LAYLEQYPVVRSRDSEFARHQLANTYGAIGFDTRGDEFGVHANYVRLSSVGIAFCSYDSAVSLSFPEEDIVRQFFSIRGSANFSTANANRPIDAWSPFIGGKSRLRLDFAPRYQQLVVRIDRPALQRSLSSLLGDASDKQLSFVEDEPDTTRMSLIRHEVFRLADELDRFGSHYSPIVLGEVERNLLFRFLLAHRHNYSDRLQHEPLSANRAAIHTIEAFIEANWEKAVDLDQLARLAGISVRTMFRQFALAGRDSPGQFAKRIRITKAAELLRRPDEKTTVTGVAFRCGFHNLGRFASEYARLIGEMPSETLKRAVRRR
jgi:AraC-like DNA-binding protein